MTSRLAVYCPDLPPARGGLADHTLVLSRALAALGADVVAVGRRGDPAAFAPIPCRIGVTHNPGAAGLGAVCRELGVRSLVVQYVPFLFARLGLAPGLVWSVGALRRAGVRIGTIVHEPWVPPTRPVWRITHGPMRRQLLALVRRSDVVYSPTPDFLEMVRPAARPGAVLAKAPVGSNVPVVRVERAEARRALGLGPDDIAIGVFSPGASGALTAWVEAAARALAARLAVQWVLFGSGSERVPAGLPPRARVRRLGWIASDEASRVLQALDLALAPFEDGLTLRRGSAMACLSHGVPVVSSRGEHFDPDLAGAAECLETADAFVESVLALVADPEGRRRLGLRGEAFYRTGASVEVLAARLLSELGGAS